MLADRNYITKMLTPGFGGGFHSQKMTLTKLRKLMHPVVFVLESLSICQTNYH